VERGFKRDSRKRSEKKALKGVKGEDGNDSREEKTRVLFLLSTA